jgi:hypothetical protein
MGDGRSGSHLPLRGLSLPRGDERGLGAGGCFRCLDGDPEWPAD